MFANRLRPPGTHQRRSRLVIVTGMKLANVRAIGSAEFVFQPGMNLIVGVNGVGKTTVLDALAICLSNIVRETNKLRYRTASFSARDIRAGADALTAECSFRFSSQDITYVLHRNRESSTPQKNKAGLPREQVHATPDRSEFISAEPDGPPILLVARGDPPPLAVLFSTNRAVPTDRTPRKGVSAGGLAGAAANAFAKRELRLGEFADWMRAQRSLATERPQAGRALAAFEDTVARFLPGYQRLRTEGGDPPQLWIDRKGLTFPVRQLSDGERGTLALILDLTRRLVQANSAMDDPMSQAEAVVLIDELDLHLHPQWQRRIVRDLETTFPRCQFIATTHSPQVIGEVPQDRIQVLAEGQVHSPTHSFGVDSNRVLEEIMQADTRTAEVHQLLRRISRALAAQRFDRSQELLNSLAVRIGESDPEITRLRTLIDFMEGAE